MAGDWIMLQCSLFTNPKVIAICNSLAVDRDFMEWVTHPVQRTCNDSVFEHVTMDVLLRTVVGTLLKVWGAANTFGKVCGNDLVLHHSNIFTIDDIAGVPNFGRYMSEVGWAISENNGDGECVRLPEFMVYNIPAEERKRRKATEKKRGQRAGTNGGQSRDKNGDKRSLQNRTVQDKDPIPLPIPLPDLCSNGNKGQDAECAQDVPRRDSVFYGLTVIVLKSEDSLMIWFDSVVESGDGLFSGTDDERELVFAAAARSLKADQPVAYFVTLVGGRKLNKLTENYKTNARHRFAAWKAKQNGHSDKPAEIERPA